MSSSDTDTTAPKSWTIGSLVKWASVDFRARHSHPDFRIPCIGVWDTVGSLGIPVGLLGRLTSHLQPRPAGIGLAFSRIASPTSAPLKSIDPGLRAAIDAKLAEQRQ